MRALEELTAIIRIADPFDRERAYKTWRETWLLEVRAERFLAKNVILHSRIHPEEVLARELGRTLGEVVVAQAAIYSSEPYLPDQEHDWLRVVPTNFDRKLSLKCLVLRKAPKPKTSGVA